MNSFARRTNTDSLSKSGEPNRLPDPFGPAHGDRLHGACWLGSAGEPSRCLQLSGTLTVDLSREAVASCWCWCSRARQSGWLDLVEECEGFGGVRAHEAFETSFATGLDWVLDAVAIELTRPDHPRNAATAAVKRSASSSHG